MTLAHDQSHPMRAVLHRPVVMVGMMGSGKTAIGRALSARLGVEFADSDAEIEMAANASIAEIFERDGETFFRRREEEVIARLMRARPMILSTGGGAFLASGTQGTIARLGVALWLDAPLDLLWERVRHKDTRPLLRTSDPLATLTRIHRARTPVYAKAALRLSVQPHASIETTTQQAVDLLTTRPDILEIQP
ncbi:shikimate kinase [Salipiger sp. IMCC34102]|uniref:shikimate kinase n=1 Tax=Salipiger sp. IMCC34102 TaxID=2510647 RepID=UPI00101DD39F|nr:shikimate kinase [Salipiger sp. IMCC34102]RYH03436.1 shikimate kinase [Salipiger sp. IMCC34102]